MPDLPPIGTTAVIVEADSSALDRAFDKEIPQKALQAGETAGESMGRGFVARFRRIGPIVAGVLTGVALRLGAQAFRIGQEIEETGSKFIAVFGSASSEVDQFIGSFGRLAGVSRTEGRALLATTGAIAQGMGFARDASAGFSQQIFRLAADLASFNNLNVDDTLRRLNSALTGERESLKALGIVITEAEVKQQALVVAQRDGVDASSQHARALATLEIATRKAGAANGDLARTSDSAANRLRRLQATFEDTRDVVAISLLPLFESLLKLAEDLAPAFERVAGGLALVIEAGSLATGLRSRLEDQGGPIVERLIGLGDPQLIRAQIAELNRERRRLEQELADSGPTIGGPFGLFRGIAERKQIEADIRAIDPLIDRLIAGQREIGRAASAGAEETVKAVKSVKDILAEYEQQLKMIGDIKVDEPVIDLRTSLQRQADVLKGVIDGLFPEVERRIDRQIEAGAPGAVRLRQFRAAAEEVLVSTDELGDKMLALNGVFIEFGLTAEDLPPFLREAAEAQGLFADESGRVKEEVSGLDATLDDIERGARGLLRVADAAGILSDDLRNALQGAVELSASIRDIAANGLSFGNFAQAFGGALSLGAGIVGLFSDTERTRQRDELVQSLDRLRQAIDTWAETLLQVPGQVALEIAGIFQGATFQPSSTVESVTRGGREIEILRDPAEFVRRLRERGLTGDDIRRLGERLNVPLDDLARAVDGLGAAGKRASDEIKALERAIDLDVIREFFETFRAQMDILQRSVDILDLSPEEELERTRKLFKDFGTGIGDDLAGLDLTTEEGRSEAERIIEEAFKAGITDPETLLALAGSNLSAEEFLDLLGRFETLLDEQETEAELQSTTQGGVFRGVSIGQGDALIALGQTQVAYLQDIAISARDFSGRPADGAFFGPLGIGAPAVGTGLTPAGPTPPPIPTDTGRLAPSAPSFSVSISQVTLGGVTVEGTTIRDADSFALGVGQLTGRRLAQLIETETRQRLENRGVT